MNTRRMPMDQDSMLVEKYMEQVTHIMDQIESRKL